MSDGFQSPQTDLFVPRSQSAQSQCLKGFSSGTFIPAICSIPLYLPWNDMVSHAPGWTCCAQRCGEATISCNADWFVYLQHAKADFGVGSSKTL